MAADYPALDAIEADFLGVYVHLWATTEALDSETPVGHPLSRACRVCRPPASSTPAATEGVGGVTEADRLPTASDHADTYDPTTDLCANWMCARCRHIRREREEQR